MAEKRGGEEAKVVNKLVLKRAVEHKIKVISEKAFISEREVYELIRSFFKKYINVDYEFTSEELFKELKKIYLPAELQEGITNLFAKVSEMEHLSRPFSKEELITVLTEFKAVVDGLIGSHYEQKGVIGKLSDAFHSSGKDHKKVLDEATLLNESERIIVKMNVLLDNSRRWASRDIGAAKKAYQELLTLYNTLDEEKKASYFKPIEDLYAILKNKGG